ncbi:hypothetical protein QBC47DRAFT_46189 [Echria macrotheca]|uniref:Uncharacterized protein n=1 Tax=Echria macrotheca TaxID=438768 RepID=A0AAJ0F4N3_9PEZI|nr:hypothetical protein QBC47DRAFT_46189 [Echria macrotheca]
MSSLLRSRAVPIIGTAAVGAGIYYTTAGGRNQPRQRAEGDTRPGMSEALQSVAGQGGARARDPDTRIDNDPRDTKIYSNSPTAESKRSPQKVRDE